MTNKKISVIPVIILVLLLTFNTSTILSNNSVAAQYYDDKSLDSLRDIICSENKNSEASRAGQEKLASVNDDSSKSVDSKGTANPDTKPSGKTGKVITPPPSQAGQNKLASVNDDSSKSGNTANYDICSNTEESNQIDKPITDNYLENREPSITSISCGQVIDESVVLTSNLDCKTDGLLVGGNDITIDLNGFTVTGPSQDSSKIGIMLTHTKNVTV
ncbi:MAG: hypothetical protein H0W19_07125 [Nitrosopumilus sp.]|nr:hypothetical protein [Nitrosopumilus sp.]